MNLLKDYWYYLLIIITIIIWSILFPIDLSFNSINEYIIGTYTVISLIGYSIIRKLKIKILCLGALFIFYGLLINFLSLLSNIYPNIPGHTISLAGIIIFSSGIYEVIKIFERDNEKIKYLSFHDSLTELYNRRYFENEMERLDSSRKIPISIIIIDLDGLKKINDNYGHKKGDLYIKEAGKIIDSATRKEDIVARIGGDEFAVILPDTDPETAASFCQRLNKECQSSRDKLCEGLSFTAGWATKEDKNTSLDDVFIRADRNMYTAKKRS